MALGPGLEYVQSTPDGCCSVNSAMDTAQSELSRTPGRPVTLNVALGLALLGLAGSVTAVLVVVGACSAKGRPPGQLAVPALADHAADAGADQRADPGRGADPGPLGARDGEAKAAQVGLDGLGVGLAGRDRPTT